MNEFTWGPGQKWIVDKAVVFLPDGAILIDLDLWSDWEWIG
jgi:hypothetical protein